MVKQANRFGNWFFSEFRCMNIIIAYKDNFDETFFDQVLCFRYENVELWLDDFKKTLISCRENWNKNFKKFKVWNKKKIKNIEPPMMRSDFDFCNYKFYLWDFCLETKDGYYDKEALLPKVYELNEWFKRNCNHE